MKRIYFIKPVGSPGPIKIGASINFYGRVDHFNFWSPVPLELMGTVEGKHQDETFLHQCFYDSHSHGEWFHATPKVLHFVPLILKHGISYAHEHLTPVGSHRSEQQRKRKQLADPVTSGPTSPSAPDVSAAVVDPQHSTATAATQLPDERHSDRPAERPVSRKIACAAHQGMSDVGVQGDRSPHQFKPER